MTGQREDARRNREAMLHAAAEILTQHSGALSLHEEVARRAGVGPATVYRHFGGRSGFARAVLADQLEQLRAAATEAGAGRTTFREVLGTVLLRQVQLQPLVAMVSRSPAEVQIQQAGVLVDQLLPAFEAAQASGELRPDVGPGDVVVLLAMVRGGMDVPGDRRPGLFRMIDVLLDGLFRPGPADG